LTSARILIVDDDKDITRVFKMGLERRGFIVTTFNDANLAIKNTAQESFDLALFDISMPNLDGYELFEEFTKHDPKTNVCFLTAFDLTPEDHERFTSDRRMKGFINKPLGFAELITRINQAIKS
jgi:DNA-binding response OmpR family regulator